MADLLIKGMKMPIEGEAVVLVLSKENGIMMAEVDEYCGAVYEAVPISPHGWLIDADKVPYFASEPWKAMATQSEIEKMPTVIEVSEDGGQDG